jgi:hypothetical protein
MTALIASACGEAQRSARPPCPARPYADGDGPVVEQVRATRAADPRPSMLPDIHPVFACLAFLY